MNAGTIESNATYGPVLEELDRLETAFRDARSEALTSNRQCLPGNAFDSGNFYIDADVINVLIIDNSENDLIPWLAELEQRGYVPLHHRVETREDFLAALKSRSWDIIISEHALPQFNGPEALKLLRNSGSDIPFIMISGVFGEEKAATMMKAGANDYLMKGNLSRIVPVLERELKAAQDRRRCKGALSIVQKLTATIGELQNRAENAMITRRDTGTQEPQYTVPGETDYNFDTTAATQFGTGFASGWARNSVKFPTLETLEMLHIFAALDRCHGNRNAAAALLGINVRTLRNRLNVVSARLSPRHE